MGRAELLRRRHLVLVDVHRDDRPRPRDVGALRRREPDAARTEDGHGRTGLDLHRAQGRAEPRQDAAADQRRALQR